MIWLQKIFNYLMGCVCILVTLLSCVILVPVILVCFICILTPPPFSMIVNLIFPLSWFMGPNGARACLDRIMSFLRFLLDKASGFFRAADH